jgi:hypothetical protein
MICGSIVCLSGVMVNRMSSNTQLWITVLLVIYFRYFGAISRLTSLSIGCLYYNCKKITYNVLLQYKIIISWSQTTFQSHVVTYKNAKQTSLKWPPFGNLDFVWRYIFCVHQPTTTKYKFMISNHFKVARGNIHKR